MQRPVPAKGNPQRACWVGPRIRLQIACVVVTVSLALSACIQRMPFAETGSPQHPAAAAGIFTNAKTSLHFSIQWPKAFPHSYRAAMLPDSLDAVRIEVKTTQDDSTLVLKDDGSGRPLAGQLTVHALPDIEVMAWGYRDWPQDNNPEEATLITQEASVSVNGVGQTNLSVPLVMTPLYFPTLEAIDTHVAVPGSVVTLTCRNLAPIQSISAQEAQVDSAGNLVPVRSFNSGSSSVPIAVSFNGVNGDVIGIEADSQGNAGDYRVAAKVPDGASTGKVALLVDGIQAADQTGGSPLKIDSVADQQSYLQNVGDRISVLLQVEKKTATDAASVSADYPGSETSLDQAHAQDKLNRSTSILTQEAYEDMETVNLGLSLASLLTLQEHQNVINLNPALLAHFDSNATGLTFKLLADTRSGIEKTPYDDTTATLPSGASGPFQLLASRETMSQMQSDIQSGPGSPIATVLWLPQLPETYFIFSTQWGQLSSEQLETVWQAVRYAAIREVVLALHRAANSTKIFGLFPDLDPSHIAAAATVQDRRVQGDVGSSSGCNGDISDNYSKEHADASDPGDKARETLKDWAIDSLHDTGREILERLRNEVHLSEQGLNDLEDAVERGMSLENALNAAKAARPKIWELLRDSAKGSVSDVLINAGINYETGHFDDSDSQPGNVWANEANFLLSAGSGFKTGGAQGAVLNSGSSFGETIGKLVPAAIGNFEAAHYQSQANQLTQANIANLEDQVAALQAERNSASSNSYSTQDLSSSDCGGPSGGGGGNGGGSGGSSGGGSGSSGGGGSGGPSDGNNDPVCAPYRVPPIVWIDIRMFLDGPACDGIGPHACDHPIWKPMWAGVIYNGPAQCIPPRPNPPTPTPAPAPSPAPTPDLPNQACNLFASMFLEACP